AGAIFHVEGGPSKNPRNIEKAIENAFRWLRGTQGFEVIIATPNSRRQIIKELQWSQTIQKALKEALAKMGIPTVKIDPSEAWFRKPVSFNLDNGTFGNSERTLHFDAAMSGRHVFRPQFAEFEKGIYRANTGLTEEQRARAINRSLAHMLLLARARSH